MELKIATSRETLFAYLETEEGLKQWIGGLKEIALESSPESDEKKGTPFTLKLRSGRTDREIRGEIIAYRNPELFGVRLFLTHAIVDLFLDLEEEGNAVLLSCDCEIGVPEGTGFLRSRMTAWQFRRTLFSRLKGLKTITESRKVPA
ncbi:SRPBCC family protein [Salinithrix halophila]|uniref:SRPBCC family protein n=2 Tax=Salinithrix halophila TaxID=1485204 RepID=A0ABV8JGE4_9BACL